MRSVIQGSRGDPFRDRLLFLGASNGDRLLLRGTPIASALSQTTETRDRLRSDAPEDSVESSGGLKELEHFVSVVDAFCPKRLRMWLKLDLI